MATFGAMLSSSTLAIGDICICLRTPQLSETINANYSAVIVRKYVIASGTKLTIQLNAALRIL